MKKEIIPVTLCVLAFLLAAACFGKAFYGTVAAPPNNWIYHFQNLIAGVFAIFAAFIGGWFVLRPTKIAQNENKIAFLQEMAHLAFIINREAYAIKNKIRGGIPMDCDEIKLLQVYRARLEIQKIYTISESGGQEAEELYMALLYPEHQYGHRTADLSKVIEHSQKLYQCLKGVSDA